MCDVFSSVCVCVCVIFAFKEDEKQEINSLWPIDKSDQVV